MWTGAKGWETNGIIGEEIWSVSGEEDNGEEELLCKIVGKEGEDIEGEGFKFSECEKELIGLPAPAEIVGIEVTEDHGKK